MGDRRCYQGSPDSIIHLIAESNPKLPGSKCVRRFALYRDGMSVGDYVAACKRAPNPQDALKDITWDWARGFIEVIEK